MMSEGIEPWTMSVENGLHASFFQPDGHSRPGTDWLVALTRGADTRKVLVRTYAADSLDPALAADSEFMARTALSYLSDLLDQGWNPSERRDLTIFVTNPSGHVSTQHVSTPHVSKKPFWKFW